jgi:drug/metabolite transporter (DMT)-like permease
MFWVVARGAMAMILVGSSVGVSRALVDAPVLTAQAVRYAIAIVLLWVICLIGRVRISRPRGSEWWWLAGIAATGLVLFNVAVVRGVAHAEPAAIAVAVACAPILIAVIGPLMQHHRPRLALVVGAVVVTVGAVIVEGTGRTDLVGVIWAVVALLCEAAFTLLAIPVLGRHGAFGVSLHTVWIGTIMFAVLGLVFEGPTAVTRLEGDDWAAIGYLALMVTAAAFLLWYSTVSALGPGVAALLTGIAPVSAAVVGIIGGTKTPALSVWIGIVVIGVGLAFGMSSGSRRRPTDRPTAVVASQPEPAAGPSVALDANADVVAPGLAGVEELEHP